MHIYQAGEEIPENEQFCYVVGKDGLYLKKTNRYFTSTVEVKEIPGLEEVKETLILQQDFKKIPYSLIEEALAFFLAVYVKHDSEAAVLLIFNKAEDKWEIRPVKQEVTGGSVDYKVEGISGICGSIHSHPSFGAFFSYTDDSDDEKLDGFHIVLGSVNKPNPDIAVSITANGKRFDCKPELIIADLPTQPEATDHPWLEYIEKKTISTKSKITVITDSKKTMEEISRLRQPKKEKDYAFISDRKMKDTFLELIDWPPEKREQLMDDVSEFSYQEDMIEMAEPEDKEDLEEILREAHARQKLLAGDWER